MASVVNLGVRIHYEVEGQGFPLVIQHGYSDSMQTWYERLWCKVQFPAWFAMIRSHELNVLYINSSYQRRLCTRAPSITASTTTPLVPRVHSHCGI